MNFNHPLKLTAFLKQYKTLSHYNKCYFSDKESAHISVDLGAIEATVRPVVKEIIPTIHSTPGPAGEESTPRIAVPLYSPHTSRTSTSIPKMLTSLLLTQWQATERPRWAGRYTVPLHPPAYMTTMLNSCWCPGCPASVKRHWDSYCTTPAHPLLNTKALMSTTMCCDLSHQTEQCDWLRIWLKSKLKLKYIRELRPSTLYAKGSYSREKYRFKAAVVWCFLKKSNSVYLNGDTVPLSITATEMPVGQADVQDVRHGGVSVYSTSASTCSTSHLSSPIGSEA